MTDKTARIASQKDGVSALSLQRALEIGSYPSAWAMLHRLRSVLVRPGQDRLTGTLEVEVTYLDGEEPGLCGGRAKGKKSLVGVAVELHQPRGYGRVRMAILADASAASLHPFVTDNVEPGATVITDAWQGYRGIERLGYAHDRRSQRAARARGDDPGEPRHDLLPSPRPRRRPRPGALPRPRRRPPAQDPPPCPARRQRAPAEPGPPPSRTTLASR